MGVGGSQGDGVAEPLELAAEPLGLQLEPAAALEQVGAAEVAAAPVLTLVDDPRRAGRRPPPRLESAPIEHRNAQGSSDRTRSVPQPRHDHAVGQV